MMGDQWAMGKACGAHRKDELCIQNFGLKNMKETDYLEDLSIDGTVILKCTLEE
jgi:hypothetical protein